MAGRRDDYPTTQTDEYGNPLPPYQGHNTTSTGTGSYGTTGTGHATGGYGTADAAGTGTGIYGTTGTGHAIGDYGTANTGGYGHDRTGNARGLRRSGSSSSSSSSEDDGMGGRRKKKGIKEKIKESLPGGRKTDEYGGQTADYGRPTTTTTTHTEPEKKGFVEKIKEKLPGSHN